MRGFGILPFFLAVATARVFQRQVPGGFPGQVPGGFPGGMPGGLFDTYIAEDSEPVQFAVQAINDMFAARADTRTRELVEVVKAQYQVVRGQKYYLTLRVTGGSQDEFCEVEVVFASWVDEDDAEDKRLELVNGPDCTTQQPLPDPPSPDQPMMPGGEYHIDDVNDDVLAALDFAINQYNGQSNDVSIYKPSIAPEEMTITTQVVAGYFYRFYDVPLTETECRKMQGSAIDLDQCQELEGGKEITCYFRVLSTLESTYELHDLRCQDNEVDRRDLDLDRRFDLGRRFEDREDEGEDAEEEDWQ